MPVLDLPHDVKAENAPYSPRGSHLEALHYRGDELMLAGPAGTGKTRTDLEKINIFAQTYKNFRGLIARKTRESLTNSALVIFDSYVLPQGCPVKLNTNLQRYMDRSDSFYAPGAFIAVGGMDKDSKIMSAEYDMIVVVEASELSEHEWEYFTTRLGRTSNVPYAQLVGDCNPQWPQHWIYQRWQRGLLHMVHSTHSDNPAVTPEYLGRLSRLTGVRRQRLYEGKWVAAEGQIYQEWEQPVGTHLIDRFDVPEHWRVLWTFDFGYTNPFVWQQWRENEMGQVFLEKEIYLTRRIVQDHALEIRYITRDDPPPHEVWADWDAEDRATLERHLGVRTRSAKKNISAGVQGTQRRLRPDWCAKGPGLLVMRDARQHPADERLIEDKLPLCTADEFPGYIWDTANNRKHGEVPVDKDNHGMDALRYLVAGLDKVTSSNPLVLPAPVGAVRTSDFYGR